MCNPRYYRLAYALFVPSVLFGYAYGHFGLRNSLDRMQVPQTKVLGLERRYFRTQLGVWALGLGLLTYAGIGTSFALMLLCLSAILGWLCDYVLNTSSSVQLHPMTYFVTLIVPMLYMPCQYMAINEMLVPLTGRMGVDTPVDIIMAMMHAFFMYWIASFLVPLLYRLRESQLIKVTVLLLVVVVVAVTSNVLLVKVHDPLHPKVLTLYDLVLRYSCGNL